MPHRSASGHDGPGWICFSAQDWWYHNRAHSDFQLMRRVAQRRPVLFVNSIGMRMPVPGRSTQFTRRILRKARSVLRFLRQPLPDTPGFHVLTPVILPFYGSSTLRAVNAWLVREQVRLVAKRLGIDPRRRSSLRDDSNRMGRGSAVASALAARQPLRSPLGVRGDRSGPDPRARERASRRTATWFSTPRIRS